MVTPAVVAGPLAVFGELLVEERGGDEVVAVLVGDETGEVLCPEFEFPFSAVQPRIKASHKQPTKAKVKRCFLGFGTKNLFLVQIEQIKTESTERQR